VSEHLRHFARAKPIGVVVAITPWNFPVSIPARKLAPALAAGCPVLFKPSEVAPLSGLRLAEIVDRHLPAGVVNTVLGSPEDVVDTWLQDEGVRALSFTGSIRVGLALAAQAAPRLTRCLLELGGNAPFVVMDDADPEDAIAVLKVAKFRNNGQSCIAANRVWVPAPLFDDFVARFQDAMAMLSLGDPLAASTTLGPLALPTDPMRIAGLVGEAEQSGVNVIRGANAVPARGHYCAPMICIDPPDSSPVARTEIFGPAVSIHRYHDLNQVIESVRRSEHGLGGYVVGRDSQRASSVAESLDVGIVGVNTGTPNTPQIPFGGVKLSGMGYEGGRVGLEQFMTFQSLAVRD
jgi:succinate-semialdehyde dehydrogenase/glutarate-semialdehyde dehydrogenase